jgi:hypothetical protein
MTFQHGTSVKELQRVDYGDISAALVRRNE